MVSLIAKRFIASSTAFVLAVSLPLGSLAYASELDDASAKDATKYVLDAKGNVVIDPVTGKPLLADQTDQQNPTAGSSSSGSNNSSVNVPAQDGANKPADDSNKPADGTNKPADEGNSSSVSGSEGTEGNQDTEGTEDTEGGNQGTEEGTEGGNQGTEGNQGTDGNQDAEGSEGTEGDTGNEPNTPSGEEDTPGDTTHDSDADGNDPTVTDPSEDVQTNPSQEELTPETGEATQSSSDIKAPAGLANSGATLGLPLVHHTYAEDMDTEKFIALIGEQARVVAQEYGLYVSVMIAQAVLESGSGKSLLAQAPNNNLFGIKGVWVDSQGAEHSIDMPTAEDDGTGSHYTIVATFRTYDSVSDSLSDYAELLRNDMKKFYQGAWRENTNTYEDATLFLQGRYATDTSYASKLVSLIDTYDLERFDEPLDWQADNLMTKEERDEALGVAPLSKEDQKRVDENAPHPLYVSEDDTLGVEDLLAEATSYLGTPYVWGGTDPDKGLDCSGLVQSAYKQALGIDLPRTTYTQQYAGERVSFDEVRPGDLLFFERAGDVSHVALYLGDGFFIHAPSTGQEVKVTSVDEYAPSFAVRVLDMHNRTDEEMDVLTHPEKYPEKWLD